MQQQTDTDLYEVLGVTKDASDKQIHRAYKKLARKFHPDVNPDNPEAEARFKEISAAHDVLGDATKRAEYDEFQAMIASGWSGRPGPGAGGFDPASGFDGFDPEGADLGDIFGQMFQRQAMTQIVRAEIGFADAVRGTDLSIGDSTIRIPPGVQTGEQLVVRRADGDLVIELIVGSHKQFGRDGLHLTLDVPISVTEAILGGKIKVPTFDGKPVSLKIPAGTPTGRTFRVRGRGITTDRATGDLRVTVTVEIPDSLDADQTDALRAYADVAPELSHPNRIS